MTPARRAAALLLPALLVALGAAAAAGGCKGPRGPAVVVNVVMDPDPEVVAGVHTLLVDLALQDQLPETLTFPEGGSSQPIDFPADFAVVASGMRGQLAIVVHGLDANDVEVVRGIGFVQLDGPRLYEVTIAIGVAWSCNDEKLTPGEVCFVRDTELPTGAFGNGVVIRDLDGAGAPDIVAAYGGNFNDATDHSGVSIYLGSDVVGFGAFYEAAGGIDLADVPPPRGNIEVEVVDAYGRANPLPDPDPDFFNDIVVSARNAGEITIWPGRGDNTFDPSVFLPVGEEPGEIRVAEMGLSPGREIFVAERETMELHMIGHPMVDLPPADLGPAIPVGVGARGFQVVDLDGDGLLDLVVAAKGVNETMVAGELGVHINTGAGAFAPPVVLTTEIGLRDVAVLDLDGDGLLDLATVNEELGVLATWYATSATTFDAPISYVLYPSSEPERIRTGDVDGDGIVDLLACDRALGSVFVLLLSAAGVPAGPVVRIKVGSDVGIAGMDIQGCDVADTDGDGVLDRIAVVERMGNVIRVLRTEP